MAMEARPGRRNEATEFVSTLLGNGDGTFQNHRDFR